MSTQVFAQVVALPAWRVSAVLRGVRSRRPVRLFPEDSRETSGAWIHGREADEVLWALKRSESVEAQKIGYDLHCTQGDRSLHVEVKGTSSEDQSFIITANELKQANSDHEFSLFLVTKALEPKPILHRFAGQELVASFNFDPLQYRACKKA